MRICLDVDGVLADLVGGLGLDPEQITTFDFADCLSPEEFARVEAKINESGFAYGLKEYPGANAFSINLCALGEVVLVTSPLRSSPTWCYDRTNWLRQSLCGDLPIIFTKEEYLVDADVLIDDSLEICESWILERDMPAVLIDRPWNRKYLHAEIEESLYRCRSYEEALFVVECCL